MKNAKAKEKQPTPDSQSEQQTWRDLLNDTRALFVIVASTILVYANSLSGDFVFDDTKQIVGNPAIRSWGNILRAFTSDVWSFQRGSLTKDIPPPYYRPLFTAYLTINYQLFGLWEPGWHIVNLLVHVGATVTIYFLLKRLSGDRLIALIAALIFGLHPAHVESVSWISGIPDPLAALFFVPSLIWYIRYRDEGKTKFLVASVLAYGLSALAKETPLALPLVLIVWELARSQSTIRSGSIGAQVRALVPLLAPYAVVAAAYLLLRFSVLGRISWKHPFMAQVPDSSIWMTVPYVFVSYLRHLIAPFYLSLIYGTSFVTDSSDLKFLLPLAILLSISIALWVYRRKISAQAWTALALIVAPLLPVLNLKVFHFEYIVQDRYLYLPSIGFCYLLALALMSLSKRQVYLSAVFAFLLLVAFGASTIAQNHVWHDAVALWQRAVYYSPNAWSTHYNLGLAYLNLKQNDPALKELAQSRSLNQHEPTILNNLALAQANAGDRTTAIATVRAALAIDPTLIEAHNNLGAFLFDQGLYPDARREFDAVLTHDLASVSARFNLARTLAAMGDYAGAIREFEAVLSEAPNDVAARYELGSSYEAAGRRQDAVAQFNQALSMDRDQKRAGEMRKKLEVMLH